MARGKREQITYAPFDFEYFCYPLLDFTVYPRGQWGGSPTQLQKPRDTLIHLAGLVLAAAIFVVDLEVSLDYAIGML